MLNHMRHCYATETVTFSAPVEIRLERFGQEPLMTTEPAGFVLRKPVEALFHRTGNIIVTSHTSKDTLDFLSFDPYGNQIVVRDVPRASAQFSKSH